MERMIKPLATIVFTAAGVLSVLYGALVPRWEPPAESPKVIVTMSEDGDPIEEPESVSYRAIIGLFPAIAYKPPSGPAVRVEPTPPEPLGPLPTLRYVGSVSGRDSEMIYYLKDESSGRLIRVGQGVPDGSIEFAEATRDSVTVKVSGRTLVIKR